MTVHIDDDAGETFASWLYGDIKEANLDKLSKVELAELAWREAARLYATKTIELQRPFVDVRMRRLANIIGYQQPGSPA